MNKNEQNPYQKLDLKYQVAIDLRLRGFSYSTISTDPRVNCKEHTARTWFMKGGTCYEAYKWKKKEREIERGELLNEVDELILDGAIEAVNVLRELAIEKKNVTAAIKLIELAQFPRDRLTLSRKYPYDSSLSFLDEVIYSKIKNPKIV